MLADLGVSSMQLDAPDRGFSFRRDEPLDMRMDRSSGATAADMLAAAEERTLADVIYELGEERHARRVARAIVEAGRTRRIETTGRLAEVVRKAIPRKGYSRIDPATRTFQAIRIWVNRELEGLDGFLTRAADRLAPGGSLVVITFHSLEDRVVKHTLRALQAAGRISIRTKRPRGADRSRDRTESTREEREVAGSHPVRTGGADMMAETFEYAIKKDVRNNPIVREVDRDRHREMWRSTLIGVFLVARAPVLGVAALRAAAPRLSARADAAGAGQ